MTPVELIIGLILLLLIVPDLCDRFGRPALVYAIYLIAGLLLGPFVEPKVHILLQEIGNVGFILLLFEIGLDIDLPAARIWQAPLKLVFKWNVLQYPVAIILALLAGLDFKEAFIAAVALNACSLSMTFAAWHRFKAPSPENKQLLLLWMISLEIFAILILTAGNILLQEGPGIMFVLQMAMIVAVVLAIGKTGDVLARFVSVRVLSTTRWRVHLIVLFVLIISAIGQRLGLSAPKTAFFLGLFISRATHEGMALTHHLRPVGQRLLIPVFFLSLGAAIPPDIILSRSSLLALASATVLLLVRDLLHRTWVKSGCSRTAFLLTCPNLTIVAIGANILINTGKQLGTAGWLLMTGLFISLISLALLPKADTPPRAETAPT